MGFDLEKTKITKVIPLFKNGDPENMKNYRPIFVLFFFAFLRCLSV